ncbi:MULTISPECIES: GGDEF domain-containing protein [Thiomicrorhabdus]|uniref:GGDEF domain-containing protein n=1 Tax=Thiomicrorhabdus xiamenensis TaxID=2739063 RepID=A0A7D4SYX2_9GAMM|nr:MULTISPECIES: GGDEF domain-containing protein [Thiomicrorhabdus]MBO1924282.1 GGDEF domain-containing protein [Thiomicrorhabdus sp. 6S3-12]QKI89424.1 GGDEF domain-containing protein [Thiomicrorhabdus xiamenensis]
MSDALKHTYSHLEAIANAMPDPIFIMGRDGTYLDIVGGQERTLYADGSSLIGKTYHQVLPEKMADRFLKVVQKAIASNTLQEIEYQLANDEVNGVSEGPSGGQWYEARVYPVDSESYGQPAAIWLAINITSRKHMEEQIEHLSSNDPLTNLYNRDFFLDLLNEELNRAKMNNQPLSLIKINLDCFKNITDGYGHEMGDKAILGAAHAIQSVIKDMGPIGRLSCDQFMVALPEVKAVDALRIGKLIQEKISGHKFKLDDGQTTCLTSHAGVTELRSPDEDSQILFKRVNEAIQSLASTREIIRIM